MVPAQELTKKQCAFIRQIIKEITITQKAVSKWQKPGQSSLENSFVPGEKVEVGLPYGSGRNRTIKWHLGTVVEVHPDFMLVQLERYRATITWGELREGRVKVKTKLVRLEVGGMGQSGHNTSISKNRQGCRLPYESPSVGDGYASPGPVITYRLDPEEIAARYGPPGEAFTRSLSAKAVSWAVETTGSLAEAARVLKVSREHLKNEMARHDIAVPDHWEEEKTMEMTQEPRNRGAEQNKSRLEIAKEKLTKEIYLQKKAEGLTDLKIMRELGIPNDVFYKLKKIWGLTGQDKQASAGKAGNLPPGDQAGDEQPPRMEADAKTKGINIGLEEKLDLSQFLVFNRKNVKCQQGKWIRVNKWGISISREIAETLPPGAAVEFLLSPDGAVLVMRESLGGITVRRSKGKAKEVACAAIKRTLSEMGLCPPVEYGARWDPGLNAWVGRREG